MKFVLKVFVLICLIAISKFAKDGIFDLPATAMNGYQLPILTQNDQAAPVLTNQPNGTEVKYQKSSLQLN